VKNQFCLLSLLFSASRVYFTSHIDKYWPRWQLAAPFKAANFWKD